MRFDIYRIKVYKDQQMVFDHKKAKPIDILNASMEKIHDISIGTKLIWKIGNMSKFGDYLYYFRFGKVQKKKQGSYIDGNFINTKQKHAIYTHVIMDNENEILAVANTGISHNTHVIANKLEQVFNNACMEGYKISIMSVKDPSKILDVFDKGESIDELWVTIKRKNNVFDDDSDFIEPLQELVEEIEADKIALHATGGSLNKSKTEKIIRNASTKGFKSTIRTKGAKYIRAQESIASVSITENVEDNDETKQFIHSKILQKFDEIRLNNG